MGGKLKLRQICTNGRDVSYIGDYDNQSDRTTLYTNYPMYDNEGNIKFWSTKTIGAIAVDDEVYSDEACTTEVGVVFSVASSQIVVKVGLVDKYIVKLSDNKYPDFVATTKAVIDAVGDVKIASGVSYDNATSGLSATTVQGALDEIGANMGEIENDVSSLMDRADLVSVQAENVGFDGSNVKSVVNGFMQPKKKSNCYLKADGTIQTSAIQAFSVTDYALVYVGLVINQAKPASSAGMTYLCFYDKNLNFISKLSNNVVFNKTLTANDIPSGAVYCRATVDFANGYVTQVNQVSITQIGDYCGVLPNMGTLFNYEDVLKMSRGNLKNMVEIASNGKCTAIYDADGYPSLMYKLPLMSIGQIDSRLGSFSDVHPAFKVNGVTKKVLYMSVFEATKYNNHLVSWFGLSPTGMINRSELNTMASSKGNGWHITTIWERALIQLLSCKLNNPRMRGNTNYGMSHENTSEFVQMYNGGLCGSGNQPNGAKWINGTQPNAWSHNNSEWGIFDIVGGFHEIVNLVKIVDGQIYIADDNNYNLTDADLVATGVYYDYTGNVLSLSNSATTKTPEGSAYANSDYSTLLCSQSYNSISEDVRKKISLLGLSPRLANGDENPLFDMVGRISINTNGKRNFVLGGAEEYTNSGLGGFVAGFDLDTITAHNNMGSRICYIE